jgi:phospholipid/cholesterol/gamma-HCH transport system substrate-binding protein
MLTRKVKMQMIIFGVIAVVSATIMAVYFIDLPRMLFNTGRYTVAVQLPKSGGLYDKANVTYRGTEVGQVTAVRLTDQGQVEALLSLRSGVPIPADLDAEVHSASAIGEQYIALLPRGGNGPVLKSGDVIPMSRTSVPAEIGALIDATNSGLQAIPRENLKTVVDEAYLAVGGLGPDISRIVKGSTQLAIDARANLDSLTTLIDQVGPVLDSQADTAGDIRAWAAHLAAITAQLKSRDTDVAGLLQNGSEAAAGVRGLLERLRPTLPVLLANLESVGQVAVTYQPGLEQILVLLPPLVGGLSAAMVPELNVKSPYRGFYLDFNLNVGIPPTCSTGFLPAQQRRSPVFEDHPAPPSGDRYCRTPHDSGYNVRGARNLPCLTKPGKRAPTAKMCESDEEYVPLNDGLNWKGDPNATLSGQDIGPASAPPAAPGIPVAEYDPADGSFVGPDGKVYTQPDLAKSSKEQSWQDMLLPAG